MLQIKGLSKIYKQRDGIPVVALDNVSIAFPENGMVFLLGKSGSGKSTLLNLLGGLDKYDNGEIIIKGQSLKKMKSEDLDSYRNTYVGFVFQEYNLLNELTVGANIGLAIRLQGRKPTNEEINEVLHKMDLENYGDRKPNQLSGGQMQRVAIARALVKNPEIIMADEPTGALDSETGVQILNILKTLSKDKLVIVVSHDREYAEKYGDRIIELSDGKVIGDVTALRNAESDESAAQDTWTADRAEIHENTEANEGLQYAFNGGTVEINRGYKLTKADMKIINEHMKGFYCGGKKRNNHTQLQKADNVDSSEAGLRFEDTKESRIKISNSLEFKLFPSKLPYSYAFKLGASALKHKKFKLVVAVFLSCIAFSLFGLLETLSAYNYVNCLANSIIDNGVKYASLESWREIVINYESAQESYPDILFQFQSRRNLGDEIVSEMQEKLGMHMQGVFSPGDERLDLGWNLGKLEPFDGFIYDGRASGFIEISGETLDVMGYTILAGKLPQGEKNEVAMPEFLFEMFSRGKYTNHETVVNAHGKEEMKYYDIKVYDDMIGKSLRLNGTDYIVTAIIDTHWDMSKYEVLFDPPDELTADALINELHNERDYTATATLMVGEGMVERLRKEYDQIIYPNDKVIGVMEFCSGKDKERYDKTSNIQFVSSLSDASKKDILWLDEPKERLAEDEIIVDTYVIEDMVAHSEHGYEDEPDIDYLSMAREYTDVGFGLKLGTGAGAIPRDVYIKKYKIVGVLMKNSISEYEPSAVNEVILSDNIFEEMRKIKGGKYKYIVGPMPKDFETVKKFVAFAKKQRNTDEEDYAYNVSKAYFEGKNNANSKLHDLSTLEIENPVAQQLDNAEMLLDDIREWAPYAGIFFSVFSAVMLGNFISTSVSYKKKEIGILRAIGARSNDVVRIFFAESFIIAMINFAISTIMCFALIENVNMAAGKLGGLMITLLDFGAMQVVMILAISIAVAFIASALPVKSIASKRPIDAIKDREEGM